MSQMLTSRRPVLTVAGVATVLALGLTACGQGAGDQSESPTPASPSPSTASTSPSASDPASGSSSAPAEGTGTSSASGSAAPTASESGTPSGSSSASPSASGSSSARPSASGTASATASPTATPPGSASPSAAPSDSPDDEVTVYWVAVDGSGRPGVEFPSCGDLLFEDTVTVGDDSGPVGDVDRVEAGIELLMDTGYEVPGGFINALYQSTLEVQDVSIDGETVTVELSGMPVSAGTCDDPRIIAQLESTARANAGVSESAVLVDGEPIQEFMSPRG